MAMTWAQIWDAQAQAAGAKAFKHGTALRDNPRQNASEQAAWERGWLDARDDYRTQNERDDTY